MTNIETTNLESRLVKLRQADEIPVACVGGVYIDTLIDGIELNEGKHILDFHQEVPVEIESRPGGSAYFVTYYLHQLGIPPKIISVIGKDENGDIFWEMAGRETSPPALDGIIRTDKGKTAVTIHLIAPTGETAMYTDRDVLRSLTWKEVHEKLYQTRRNNGLIYIAGIFKTNLHRNLAKAVASLKKEGAIICLDYGRLHQGQHTNARGRALRDALPLADFYFTTRKELCQFLDLVAQKPLLMNKLQNQNIRMDEIMPAIVHEAGHLFPPVTIIYDNKSQTPMRLVSIRHTSNKMEYIPILIGKTIQTRHSYVGFGNMFQAVFMQNLIRSPYKAFAQLIPDSAKLAQRCLEWTCAQLGRNIAEAVDTIKKSAASGLSPKPISDPGENINRFETIEQIMRERVSLDELHSICLALSIDFDDLPGEAKGRKIVSLLNRLQKRESLNSLRNWFIRNRTDIDLPNFEDHSTNAKS